MEKAIEIIELLLSYGIDIVIVLSILAMIQGAKKYLKLKKEIAYLTLIFLGLLIGILKIISGQVKEELYITVIFGYSGISCLLYIAIDIFLPAIKEKFFPSVKKLNGK